MCVCVHYLLCCPVAPSQYHELKLVGHQTLDEQFRAAHGHLRVCVDLRENYALALIHFRESCGRGPQALLRDCIELVVTRAKGSELSLSLDVIGDVSGCG